ncbi:MAG: hypothetical protein RL266_2268 [Bacteroidota bacterium]|jgi:hypothetical protein
MFENPIDKDKITETPSTLPYAHTIGGVVIRPEDMGRVKGYALAAMSEQTDAQLAQIKEQIELLAKQARKIERRKELSLVIYGADMGFKPLIGHRYFLYQKKSEGFVLSMVGAKEWGRSMPYEKFLAEVKLLSDHTWEIIDEVI